jgi:ATP-dependent helicase/nuclease subunit B
MRLPPDLCAAAFAGRTILTPNAELASAILYALERSQRDRGLELWLTPRVRDFGSFMREQYLLQSLTEGDAPRCLSEVEERELWREVVAAADSGHELLEAGAVARAARRARRTLAEYAIPLSALESEPSEETQAFLRWNDAFNARCRELNCISVDALLLRLQLMDEPIAYIESPLWRPAVRQWLAGKTAIAPAEVKSVESTVLHLCSPDLELGHMAAWAQKHLAADAQFRAWMCVPDLSQRRVDVAGAFDAALMPRRFFLENDAPIAPYAIAGGTPLADYPSVRPALSLLRLSSGKVSFVEFSDLSRGPQLQASSAEAGQMARLDVLLRERGPYAATLEDWLLLAEQMCASKHLELPAAIARLKHSRSHLSAARGAKLLSAWLPLWTAAFDAAPWSQRHRWSSVEYQAAERLRELLRSLATADTFFGPRTAHEAQAILLRAAGDTDFQPKTGVPPIWISDQLADPWLNYSAIWVAGMSEDAWPPPPQPVALLPVTLQRRYGVVGADHATRLQQASQLQQLWLKRAPQCVFSSADTADGRSLPSSRLLPGKARLVARHSGPPARPLWSAQRQEAPRLERFIDELAPPFASPERTHGVATLRAQARCAFRGFAETRLQADRLELPVPGFNERERGELVHHALEWLWGELRDSRALHALSAQAEGPLLVQASEQALRRQCAKRDPGALWRARERIRLQGLLARWLAVERLRAPFTVESLESAPQDPVIGGVSFRVRIDRCDILEDGSRVLIDYKTGSAFRDWRGQRPDNPQLPVYAFLRPDNLVAVAYARVNATSLNFVDESERANVFKLGGRASDLEAQPNFAALLAIWSTRLTNLATEFAGGRAEVAPTLSACKSCHLSGLCRVPAALSDIDIDD